MIRTVDNRILQTSQETEIAQFFEDLKGKYGVANALAATLKARRTPATTPQLLQMRIGCDNLNDPLYKNWFTTMTEIDIAGDNAYITHGGLYLKNTKAIKEAIDSKNGIVNGAARLSPEQSKSLIEGKTETRIITYEQFLEESRKEEIEGQYTVKLDRKVLAQLPNTYITLAQWAKDPRAIVYAGNKQRAEAYAEKLRELKLETPWLSADNTKGDDRGRLVFVGGRDGYCGVSGDDDLDNDGRFAGVAPEALVAKNGAPLEHIVRVVGSGEAATINGQLYFRAPKGARLE